MCAHHHAACVVAALIAVARLVVHGRVSVNLRGWLNVVFHKIGVFTREEGACHLFFGAEQSAETLADVKHVDVANVNHLASIGQHRLLERCHQWTAATVLQSLPEIARKEEVFVMLVAGLVDAEQPVAIGVPRPHSQSPIAVIQHHNAHECSHAHCHQRHQPFGDKHTARKTLDCAPCVFDVVTDIHRVIGN